MKNGYLSQYFGSVAVKKLSAIEVNIAKSHQHEFNGSSELKRVLGLEQPREFKAKFLLLNDEQNITLSEDRTVKWYDARANHPTRSEYRLYFPDNSVMEMAREGDSLFIAKCTDGTLFIIIAPGSSTIENQLYWLFGLEGTADNSYKVSDIEGTNDHRLDFAAKFILDELGVETEEPESEREQLDRLVAVFNKQFPSTVDFSKFARNHIKIPVDVRDDPDGALEAYMEWELRLFKRLEYRIVETRLTQGFITDGEQNIDEFLKFSLGVHNRRKSRAGLAFEEHVTYILEQNKIKFSRRAETENKAKPDFLFPGITEYKNTAFPASYLTMLGAKTSCKDRWRQILPEAERIREKHLLTIEPGISINQTNEMKALGVQLVLPKNLHNTCHEDQQSWLMSVKDFISFVSKRQQ